MPKIKDLIGQTFNKLTVVEYVGQNKNHYSLWKTKCGCGREKITTRKMLVSNQVKSCGLCGERSTVSKDLSGRVFGKLTVIADGKNRTEVIVRCECGVEKSIKKEVLSKGDARSCGCQLLQNRVNFSGQTFGKLTVIRKLDKKYLHERMYLAECECGNEVLCTGTKLQKGYALSCDDCHIHGLCHDLTGQRFGMLTVIKRADDRLSSGKTAWEVACDCGGTNIAKTNNLLNGHTKSCGCQISYNRVDHTGKVFGRLTVLEPFDVQGSNWYYRCLCSCSEEVVVNGAHLTRGSTNSCGCLQKELASKRMSGLKGELAYAWKGGITEENSPRNTREYMEWRKLVLHRDNYCCKVCGDTKELCIHHLYSFVDNPDKRTDINNGETLCNVCHICFHIDFGRGNNTPKQFYEWKKLMLGN